MRDVNRARSEQQRFPPVREEWNVRGVGNGPRLESGHGREPLGWNVGAELDVRVPLGPFQYHLLDWLDVANEAEHDLRLRVRGYDVGLGAAFERSDVDRGFTQHRIRWKGQLPQCRQELEHRLDRRTTEVWIR